MDLGLSKKNRRLMACLILLGVFVASSIFSSKPALAATGINQQINFQGRLLNSQGATVPDGFYNIEFKIYQDGDGQSVGNTTGSPSGSLKWTEDYLNVSSHGVKVVNGFLSVQLGSINPFGSSIDWNQSTLWLSMNIGGTGASCTPFSGCSPDGEMIPMQPLTTAVYALNSNQLGGLTASAFGQLASDQTWTGYNTYKPISDSITAFQVQSAGGTTIFNVDTTNSKVGTANVTTASTNSQIFNIASGASTSSGNTGDVTVKTGNATSGNSGNIALDVGTATGTKGSINIGNTNPTASINIGSIGSTANNTTVHIADSSAGVQAVTIGSTNSTSSTTIQAGSGGITSSSGNTTQTIASSGVTVQTTTNSATAFQTQNTTANPLLNVNTSATSNLLKYPSFESGTFNNAATGWAATAPGSIAQNTTAANSYDGLDSVDFTTTSSNGSFRTTAFTGTVAANTYYISFYVMPGSAMNANGFTVTLNDGSNHNCTPASQTLSTTSFTRVSCSATTSSNLSTLTIAQNDSTARTHIYIDDVQLQSTGVTNYQIGTLQLPGTTFTSPAAFENAANSATAFQIQNSSGTSYITGDSTNTQLVLGTASSLTGKLAFATAGGGTLTVNPTSSASSFTLTLPAETGTVCTNASTSACSTAGGGYVQFAPGSIQADGTSNNSIFINKTNASGNILELQKSGSDVFTVANGGNVTATGTINNATISGGTVSGGTLSATAVNSLNVSGTAISGTGALTVDANGSNTVSIGGTSTGNVLLAGGLGSTGCTVNNGNGNFDCNGTINGTTLSGGTVSGGTVSGGTLTTTAVNSLNVSGTAISGTGALTVDANGSNTISIGGTSTGDVLLGGGSGSTGCTVTNANGNFACTGTINSATISGGTVSGGSLSATAVNGLNVSSTAIAVSTAATGLTIDAGTTGTVSIGAASSGDILLGGGSGSTGCTVTNASGAFACTNTITGTTLNGTAGLNTGAGAGTQRIDSSGNLVSVGNVTTTGATTFTTTGANGITFKPGSDSGNTTAFQIQNSLGNNFVSLDTNSSILTVGNSSIAGATTAINGGTGATAITLTQGTGGGIVVGGTGSGSTVAVQCGAGTSTNCGFANNATDHSTTVGSTTGTSLTTIQSGSGGISFNGNATVLSGQSFTVGAGASTFSGSAGGNSNAVKINTGATTNAGLTIQGTSSQTANLLQLQNANSSNLFTVDPSGNHEISTGYLDTAFGGFGSYGNLVLRSEQLNNGSWTATNITVTANDGASNPAPDGNTTADKLVSTSSGSHTLTQSIGSTGNNTYTFSMWIKANSSTQPIQLRIDSNGTPATGTAASFSVTTDWQRFAVTQTFSSGVTTITPTLVLSNHSATIVGWGAQVIQSSLAQVYVRTVGANVPASDGLVDNGTAIFQNSANSATAYQFQNAAGTNVATIDTSNGQLVLGTAGSLTSPIAFGTAGGGTLTLTPTSSASNFTITLPAETGTVCTTASTSACSTAGAGFVQLAPSSVQADGTTNNSIFINKSSGTGNILELQKSAADVFKVDNTGNVTSTGQNTLSRNSSGASDYSFGVTGTPTASSSSSLIRIGNAITGGNSAANGGTYLSIVEPSSSNGSAADFVNFQNNTTSEFSISSAGALLANGTYNTNTFTGNTLTFGTNGAASITSSAAGSNNITVDTGASGGTAVLGATAGTTQIGNTNAAHTISIGSSGTSTAQAITIGSAGTTSSTLTLQGGNGANALIVQTGNNGSTAGTIQIGNTAGAFTQTISLGNNNNAANTVQIGTGTAQDSVTIGNTTNTNSSVAINAGGTGGITLGANTSLSANSNFTYASGTGNFDAHNGTGTFDSTSGTNQLNGNTTVTGTKTFTVNGGLTTLKAGLLDQSGAAGTVGAIIQGAASQSASLLQLQDSTGASVLSVDASGNHESLGYLNTGFGGFGSYGNLLTRSEQFDQGAGAPWTYTNVTTPTANNATPKAPDGNATAEGLASTSSGTHTVAQTYASGGNNTYTFSVWLSTNAATQAVQLRIDSNGTPATGTAASFTATTTWQRFSVTQTFTSGVTTVSPTIVINANSVTVNAWGAQLIQASTAGVYVRTIGSTVAASDGLVDNGTAIFQNSVNSTTAYQFQNASGTTLFNVDTTNSIVGTALVSSAATNSQALTIATGASTSSGNTGALALNSGNATSGNSGTVSLDVGTATATKGSILIGTNNPAAAISIGAVGATANASTIHIADTSGNATQAITIGANAAGGGNAANNTLTLEGGSGTTSIQIGNSAQNHGIQIGTGASINTITMGSTNSTSTTTIQGGSNGTTPTVSIQAAGTGVIAVGTANSNTIQIGATGSTANADTVHIADSTGATQAITIGGNASNNGAAAGTTIALQAGQSALSLANSGATLQTFTNSATALQVEDAIGGQVLSVGTSDTNTTLANPSFEDNTITTAWAKKLGSETLARSTTTPYIGNADASLGMTLTNQGVKQNVTLAAQQWTFSGFFRISSGTVATGSVIFGYARDGSTETDCVATTSPALNSTVWTRYSCTLTTAATSGTPYFYIRQNTAQTNTLLIDGVQIDAGNTALAFGTGTLALNGIITSPVTFQNQTDSANALSIISAAGNTILQVDSESIGGANSAIGHIALGAAPTNAHFLVSGGFSQFSNSNQTGTNATMTLNSTFSPSTGNTNTSYSNTVTNTPTSNANTAIAQTISLSDATTLANTLQGMNVTVSDTGSGAKTVRGLFVDTSGTTNGSASVTTALFKGASSTTAFQIQNAGSNTLFNVDTSGGNVSIDNSGLAGTVQIGTTTGTVNQTINIGTNATAAGSTNILHLGDAATATDTVTIGSASNSASSLALESGTGTTSLFNGNTAHTIQVGTGGTSTAQAITIGSATNTTSTLTLQGGTGASAITFTTGATGGTAGGIVIGNTSGANSQSLSLGTNATSGATNVVHIGDAATATDTVTIGNASATGSSVTLQGGTGASALSLQAAATGGIVIGTTNANTITVGATGATANIDTIHIADTTGANQAVTIGGTGANNGSAAGTTVKLQAGQTALSLSNTTAVVQTFTNSTNAFQVQNAVGSQLLNIDTTNTNLVTNPSIEQAIAGNWTTKGTGPTVAQSNTEQYIGSNSLSVTTAGTANAGSQESITLTANTTYTLSMYVRSANATISTINIGRQDVSGTDLDCLTAQTVIDTAWSKLSCSFTTGGTITSSNIYIKDTGTNHLFYVDAVQLTTFSLLSDASLETAIAGVWVAYTGAPTLTQDATVFLDGTHSLKTVEAGAGQGVKETITLNNNRTYYLSFWAYGASAFSTLNVGYSSTGASGGDIDCLTAQSIALTTWNQYQCIFTTPSSNSGAPYIYFKDTGSGHTFYIDAIQLSLGPPLTLYTAGAPAAGSFLTNPTTSYSEGQISLNGTIDSPVVFQNQSDSTSALRVQDRSGVSVLNVDTANDRVGINTASPNSAFEINSGASNTSGLRFTQLNSTSTGGTSFTGILGLDTSGNVGLSQASVSLTSPALAYWDGTNDPTTGSQAYPTATLSGNASFVGGGNGVQLTPATNTQAGSINWNFSQVSFEETQFQFKAGGGTGADSTWFYSYADGVPTTEYGAGFTKGYIIYFSEWHHCVGVAYGGYTDNNQCSSGGGVNPLASSLLYNIADNNFHNVDIQIRYNQIIVRWDGQIVLNYTDLYTRDLSNLDFGFGARTGGNNDVHDIKGLLVTKLGSDPSKFAIDPVTPLASGLYWDITNTRLGIGSSSPDSTLEVDGTESHKAIIVTGNGTTNSVSEGSGTNLPACATTGTANATANSTITGVGTSFTAAMVGDTIILPDGVTDTITAFSSSTSITVAGSRVECKGAYSVVQKIYSTSTSGLQIGTSAGEVTGVTLNLDQDSDSTFNAGTDTNTPTEVNGAMFYSKTDHQFMCGVAGKFIGCSGLLYSNTAASSANNTCIATCAAFSLNAPIPANYCQSGRSITVKAKGTWGDTTSATTLALELRYGTDGTTRANDSLLGSTSPAITETSVSQSALPWSAEWTMICDSTTAIEAGGTFILEPSSTTTTTNTIVSIQSSQATGLATTGASNLYIFPSFGANNAANTATLRQLVVTGN